MASRFTAINNLRINATRVDKDFNPAIEPKYGKFPDELRKQVNNLYRDCAVASSFDLLGPAPDDPKLCGGPARTDFPDRLLQRRPPHRGALLPLDPEHA